MSRVPVVGPANASPPQSPVGSDRNTYMGVSLRGWAISAISAVAVLTALGGGLITVWGKYKTVSASQQTTDDVNRTLRDANSNLVDQLKPVAISTMSKLSEADKHARNRDHFETFPIDSSPEEVKAEYYPSDGCIHITRKNPQALSVVSQGRSRGKVLYGQNDQDYWIPDPQRVVATEVPPVAPAGDRTSAMPVSLQSDKIRVEPLPVFAEVNLSKQVHLERARFQGSCLNPHPGQFQVRNEQINACEVKVWRQFTDGCTHFQMYNACTGQWAPGVNWTFCQMQHQW